MISVYEILRFLQKMGESSDLPYEVVTKPQVNSIIIFITCIKNNNVRGEDRSKIGLHYFGFIWEIPT